LNILAIGCIPADLELGCFGILSRYIRDGHNGYLVIAKDKMGWTQTNIEVLRESSRKIGISQVYFTDKFDYSAVTQNNLNLLRSFIEIISSVSLVIIPFWKSVNEKRKILGKSSLTAFRSIENILMYESDKNCIFIPSVFFIMSKVDISIKISCLAAYRTEHNNSKNLHRKIKSLHGAYARKMGINVPIEAFESYKLLLINGSDDSDTGF
jgi:hypothetical protein